MHLPSAAGLRPLVQLGARSLGTAAALPQGARPSCLRSRPFLVANDEADEKIDDLIAALGNLPADEELDMPDDFDPNEQSWIEYNFVADYGFDPFKLASVDLLLGSAGDKGRPRAYILRDYREAELRHGRLAMLAALAWPVQELLSPVLSRVLREPLLLTETGGRSPSVLNGGLEQSSIPLTILVFGLGIAIVDWYSLRLRDGRDDWMPGDFGFDPLNLLGGASLSAKREMQEKEINNGRLAMIAVTSFVIEEFVSGRPVVELTPWLFKPIIAWPEVQRLFDAEFASSAFRPE